MTSLMTRVFTVLWCAALMGCDSAGTLTIVLDDSRVDEALFLEIVVAMPWEEGGATCDDLLAMETPLTGDPVHGLDFVQQHGLQLDPPDELPVLGVLEEGALVAARARDVDCAIVDHGCIELAFGRGGQEVRLALQSPDPLVEDCGPEYRCEDGTPGKCLFGECLDDEDCWDEDPTSTNRCERSWCITDDDADGDGIPPPLDCDDLDPDIPTNPSQPRCGEARDHDCDGTVDDLDGCGVPVCETYELYDVRGPAESDSLLYGHSARGVFVSGSRVVATLVKGGNDHPIIVLQGSLSNEGSLESLGALEISGTEDNTPFELAVYGDRAFVAHRADVEVIDLSDPALPPSAHLGQLPKLPDSEWGFRHLTVAAPILLVGTMDALMLYDISRISIAHDWPVLVGELRTTSSMLGFMTARHGNVLGTGMRSMHLECVSPIWAPETPRSLRECFDIEETGAFPPNSSGEIESIVISSGAVVHLVASHIERDDDGENQRLLYRLRGNDEDVFSADPIGDEGADAVILGRKDEVGETVHLSVVGNDNDTGDLLIRSASGDDDLPAQLFLHPAQSPDTSTQYIMDDTVWDVAVVGDLVLLAAGSEGLLVGRLRCGP